MRYNPFRPFLNWYKAKYDRFPVFMALCTCSIKASASDTISQTQVEKCEKFDFARNLRFATWGGLQTGVVQHFVYNVLFTRMFGPEMTVLNALRKSLAECWLYIPSSYFPSYYTFRSLTTGGTVADGLTNYKNDFTQIMQKYFIVWFPANMITFGIMPPQFRIAFVASVSFCWSVFLSYFSPMVKQEEKNTVKNALTDTAETPAKAETHRVKSTREETETPGSLTAGVRVGLDGSATALSTAAAALPAAAAAAVEKAATGAVGVVTGVTE